MNRLFQLVRDYICTYFQQNDAIPKKLKSLGEGGQKFFLFGEVRFFFCAENGSEEIELSITDTSVEDEGRNIAHLLITFDDSDVAQITARSATMDELNFIEPIDAKSLSKLSNILEPIVNSLEAASA